MPKNRKLLLTEKGTYQGAMYFSCFNKSAFFNQNLFIFSLIERFSLCLFLMRGTYSLNTKRKLGFECPTSNSNPIRYLIYQKTYRAESWWIIFFCLVTFILQFLLLSILFGIPLFVFHVSLGQYLGSGVIDVWRISPIHQVKKCCTKVFSVLEFHNISDF